MPAVNTKYKAAGNRETTEYGFTCGTYHPAVLSNTYFVIHTLPLPKTLVGVLYLYISLLNDIKYKVKLLPRPCMPLADGGSNQLKSNTTTEHITPATSDKQSFRLMTIDRLHCIPKAMWGASCPRYGWTDKASGVLQNVTSNLFLKLLT